MKFFAKSLEFVGHIWIIAAVLIMLISYIGIWREKGFSELMNIYSLVIIAIAVAPGIALSILSRWLRRKYTVETIEEK